MFKLATLVMLTLVAFSTFAKVTVTKSGDHTHYEFTDISVDIRNAHIQGQSFIKASLKGADNFTAIHYKLTMPEVPVIRFYTVKGEVSVKFSNEKALHSKALGKQLAPNMESLEKVPGAQRQVRLNKSFLKSNSYYPKTRYEINDAGSINGVKQQLVTIYPFNWNPGLTSYKLMRNFSVTVKNSTDVVTSNTGRPTFAFIVGREFKNSPAILKYENFKK